jgi:hypothetical protein
LPAKLQSATQVFADNITYHPSGAMLGMTYGNGQVFSQALNARLQPQKNRLWIASLAMDLMFLLMFFIDFFGGCRFSSIYYQPKEWEPKI